MLEQLRPGDTLVVWSLEDIDTTTAGADWGPAAEPVGRPRGPCAMFLEGGSASDLRCCVWAIQDLNL